MQRSILTAYLAALVVSQAAVAESADDILGLYWNPDRDGVVEIYSENGEYHGRAVWSAEPMLDPANASRDMLGVPFLTGFDFDGDDRWKGGTVYAPDNGRTYRGTLWLDDGDLKMRGFVGVSFFGRTATFPSYPEGASLPGSGYRFDGFTIESGQ